MPLLGNQPKKEEEKRKKNKKIKKFYIAIKEKSIGCVKRIFFIFYFGNIKFVYLPNALFDSKIILDNRNRK